MLCVEVGPLGHPGHQGLLQGPGIHLDVANHHALGQGLHDHAERVSKSMEKLDYNDAHMPLQQA